MKMPRRKNLASAFATSIIHAMKRNASFPTPTPPLSVISADLAAYEAAEATVATRVKGAAVARDRKYITLRADLEYLMAYVQQVADGNPANARSIITSARFAVRKVTRRVKSAIAVQAGQTPGSVKVVARAVARHAGYEWQFSKDQKSWTNAPTTLQAKTVIVGLTSGAVYSFRFRAVTNTGAGAFSQVVQILVR